MCCPATANSSVWQGRDPLEQQLVSQNRIARRRFAPKAIDDVEAMGRGAADGRRCHLTGQTRRPVGQRGGFSSWVTTKWIRRPITREGTSGSSLAIATRKSPNELLSRGNDLEAIDGMTSPFGCTLLGQARGSSLYVQVARHRLLKPSNEADKIVVTCSAVFVQLQKIKPSSSAFNRADIGLWPSQFLS